MGILIPVPNKKDEEDVLNCIDRSTAFINLIYGNGVLEEKHFSGFFHTNSNKVEIYGDYHTIDEYIDSLKEDFINSQHNEDANFEFKPRTLELINECSGQRLRYVRFMLLWLAIECEIGNGIQRERFCTSELKSNLVNSEQKRLFYLRNRIFKDADAVRTNIFDEYSVRSILRLRGVRSQKLRRGLLVEFETRLKNR